MEGVEAYAGKRGGVSDDGYLLDGDFVKLKVHRCSAYQNIRTFQYLGK
jgi:hypothetical protein